MYPEIFRVGDFSIPTYGVLLAVGLLLALLVASRLAKRDGLPENRIYDLGLWTILGGLLGAKIRMLLTEDTAQFFSLDFLRSGGVYYGGFLGGFLTVVVLARLQIEFLESRRHHAGRRCAERHHVQKGVVIKTSNLLKNEADGGV